MSKIIKTVAATAMAVSFVSGALAQSGPVDSKGQAGSVQQFDNRVTQGTNTEDAANARAAREQLRSGGDATSGSGSTTGSVGSKGAADAPGGSSSGAGNSPQSGSR